MMSQYIYLLFLIVGPFLVIAYDTHHRGARWGDVGGMNSTTSSTRTKTERSITLLCFSR